MKNHSILAFTCACTFMVAVNMQHAVAQNSYLAVPAAPPASAYEGSVSYPSDTTSGSYVGDGVPVAAPAVLAVPVADASEYAIQVAPVLQTDEPARAKKSEKQQITEALAIAIVDLRNQSDAFDEFSEALDEESDVIETVAELLEEYRDQLKAGYDIGMTVAEYNECIDRYNEKVSLYEVGKRVQKQRETRLLAKAKELDGLLKTYRLAYGETKLLEKRVQVLLASNSK